jgi:DNA polymerase III alpha subunit
MDVDIDFRTDFDPLHIFENAVRASQVQNGELKKHNAGIYFQSIPKDKVTGFSAIPYKEAQELGYFKIDFLHLSMLDYFEKKSEIRFLLKQEPDWLLMQQPSVVGKLFQLHNHFELVSQVKPQSVQELADCIALIRPGKRWLLDSYLKNREAIRQELYRKPDDGRAYYKRPHAIAYSLTIVLQLHLIKAKVL